MPNALVLGDAFSLKVFCTDTLQNGINVVHYVVTATVGGGVTDQDVADAMSTGLSVPYRAYLNDQDRFAGVQLAIIDPNPFPTVKSTNGNGLGANVSDRLPPAATFLLSPRSNTAGRSGRGRTYLPFWNEDQSSSTGHPTAGAIAQGTAVSNVLFATTTVVVGANSVQFTPIIFTRSNPALRKLVLGVVIRQEWATQRRRSFITKPDVLGP